MSSQGTERCDAGFPFVLKFDDLRFRTFLLFPRNPVNQSLQIGDRALVLFDLSTLRLSFPNDSFRR